LSKAGQKTLCTILGELRAGLEQETQVFAVALDIGSLLLEDGVARLEECFVRPFVGLLRHRHDLVEDLDIWHLVSMCTKMVRRRLPNLYHPNAAARPRETIRAFDFASDTLAKRHPEDFINL